MKDYQRFTEQNTELLRKGEWTIQSTRDCTMRFVFSDDKSYCVGNPIDQLAYFENAIESGELCDREEVRKETAREIFLWLAEHQEVFTGRITISCGDFMDKRKEYGVELFGNSDKGEDKE